MNKSCLRQGILCLSLWLALPALAAESAVVIERNGRATMRDGVALRRPSRQANLYEQ